MYTVYSYNESLLLRVIDMTSKRTHVPLLTFEFDLGSKWMFVPELYVTYCDTTMIY